MPIQWLFFDIGDTLFDENGQHLYYMHSVLLALRRNGVDVTWDAYHARVAECVLGSDPGNAIPDAGQTFVTDAALWEKIAHEARAEYQQMRKPRPYGLLLDNIQPVLQQLRQDFRLAIIANQHPPVLQALDDYGIGPYFDFKLIDEVVGVSKPAPAIFLMALEKASVAASEVLMIGDRPDNDIAPAKALGMSTLRFRRGLLYALGDPRSEAERADLEVREPVEIVAAVQQLSRQALEPSPQPLSHAADEGPSPL